MSPRDLCTKETCPPSMTIMGYAPTLSWNALFLAVFAVSTIAHTIQGVRYKTWSCLIAMGIGTLCEAIGYGGRIILTNDPFSDVGFKLQIVLLTFAPAFFSAGIYLQLKHLVITFGSDISRIRPAWYTYIFITCDIISIAFQGAGGGLASAANGPGSLLTAGNNLMMTGLSFQVFTLVVFAVLAAEYFVRVARHAGALNESTRALRASKRFRWFLAALLLSYIAILTRCIYRVAEMSGGWGNDIMRDELLFIILDSLLCAIATIALNAFHPGMCFETHRTTSDEKDMSRHESDAEYGVRT